MVFNVTTTFPREGKLPAKGHSKNSLFLAALQSLPLSPAHNSDSSSESCSWYIFSHRNYQSYRRIHHVGVFLNIKKDYISQLLTQQCCVTNHPATQGLTKANVCSHVCRSVDELRIADPGWTWMDKSPSGCGLTELDSMLSAGFWEVPCVFNLSFRLRGWQPPLESSSNSESQKLKSVSRNMMPWLRTNILSFPVTLHWPKKVTPTSKVQGNILHL